MTDQEVGVPPRREYRNPPVVEALSRLGWAREAPWTVTTPGLLFEALRDAYPEEPQARSLLQADFRQQAGDSNFEVRTGPPKMAFSAAGGSRLLMVGQTDVSAHSLAPYEGWESLEERLFDGFQHVQRVLNVEPKFSQLGLRYINRIEIPEPRIKFEDFLTVSFQLPPGFPDEIHSFIDRVEVAYPDGPIKLAFTWASTDAPEESIAFILDFDLTTSLAEPVELAEARQLLGKMKEKEGVAFEGLLQDRLREMFS